VIEAIHKHLLSELDRSGRSDTVFVVCGVLFNLLVLSITWSMADSISRGKGNIAIFALFVIGALVVSTAVILILINSRKICAQCHEALTRVYSDSNVAHYMPAQMAELGSKRFVLSLIVVVATGLLTVVVPCLAMLG
jgi:hypothetical protein